MRFYEMFYGIEEKKMKEYIIPIEDIIVKPELFYAHCDRGNGKNPEILKEHVGTYTCLSVTGRKLHETGTDTLREKPAILVCQ